MRLQSYKNIHCVCPGSYKHCYKGGIYYRTCTFCEICSGMTAFDIKHVQVGNDIVSVDHLKKDIPRNIFHPTANLSPHTSCTPPFFSLAEPRHPHLAAACNRHIVFAVLSSRAESPSHSPVASVGVLEEVHNHSFALWGWRGGGVEGREASSVVPRSSLRGRITDAIKSEIILPVLRSLKPLLLNVSLHFLLFIKGTHERGREKKR